MKTLTASDLEAVRGTEKTVKVKSIEIDFDSNSKLTSEDAQEDMENEIQVTVDLNEVEAAKKVYIDDFSKDDIEQVIEKCQQWDITIADPTKIKQFSNTNDAFEVAKSRGLKANSVDNFVSNNSDRRFKTAKTYARKHFVIRIGKNNSTKFFDIQAASDTE